MTSTTVDAGFSHLRTVVVFVIDRQKRNPRFTATHAFAAILEHDFGFGAYCSLTLRLAAPFTQKTLCATRVFRGATRDAEAGLLACMILATKSARVFLSRSA